MRSSAGSAPATAGLQPGKSSDHYIFAAPKRKAVVRLHALSFYTPTAGRGARGETRTPTVIGLFS